MRMSRQEAELKVKAVAFEVAANLGNNEAVKLLKEAASALADIEWRGSGPAPI